MTPGTPHHAQYEFDRSDQSDFRVNQQGEATYSIALAASSGMVGVIPHINLNYSSNDGDEIAGIGWSIGGPTLPAANKRWGRMAAAPPSRSQPGIGSVSTDNA